MSKENIRNIAIIAHVDHGKTTLVDALLKQSGIFRENQHVAERVMDSNDIEKERGITILAKCTSVTWNGYKLNIVDTPGHADFGGEVERILGMVDGVVVLVDAAEGPMPQTKFVVSKALKLNLRPIVVINKVDRPDARASEVHNEVFDLFALLEASDEQLDFPTLYASGRSGWASLENVTSGEDLTPLFETIVNHVPSPDVDVDAPFSFLATTLDSDPYLGRILTGKIYSGKASINMPVKALDIDGKVVENGRLTKLLAFKGVERIPLEEAQAGDIVAIAGLSETTVGNTLCALDVENPIPSLPIDPPTISMTFSVNNSPFAGKEGTKVTSRLIRDRLLKEAEINIAIKIHETAEQDAFEVAGRGELQLGVLIENMRREGFELSISRPRVIFQTDENGQRLEPFEEILVDVDEDFSGVVVEKLGLRRGQMIDMRPSGGGKVRLTFTCPSRGLIGYLSEFLTDTRGTGVMSRLFSGYRPFAGPIEGRRAGVLISNAQGKTVAYALANLEERGILFVGAGVEVYEGMIIGEHSRDNDLEVNPLKAKQLSNVRAAGKDDAIKLTPPKLMSLEDAMSYIQNDELIEVTPKSIRLRKELLDPNARKRASKSGE